MNISRYCKLFFCCLLSTLLSVSEGKAQKKDNVVFDNYTHTQADILHLLKKDGGISSFTSMSVLKQNAQGLKENTVVPVNLQKPGKRVMDPSDMVGKRKESVLIVWKYFPATAQPDRIVAYATAIVLSADGVCATNYHVLRSMLDESIKLNRSDSILFVSTASGKLYPLSAILTYNKTADMALFKLDTNGDSLMPFPVGQDLPVGTTVHTLTHPEGYLYSYSKGVVSRNISTDSSDPYTNRTEITADYAKGSSGGPIFDDFGNLVSMVSTTFSIYYTDRPQINFQMAVKQTIPVSLLLSVMKNMNAN